MTGNNLDSVLRRSASVWLCACLAGLCCHAAAVKPYRVPKEKTPGQAAGAAAQPMAAPVDTSIAYKAPSDWEELPPGPMRAASLRVKSKEGKSAEVSVVPLPGFAGSDWENVNRWRGQVGLAPVQTNELAKLAEKISVGKEDALLYDLAGQRPGSGDKVRILAAIHRHQGMAWFYKMAGDSEVVSKQKTAFVKFLKTVQYQASAANPEGLPPSHPPVDGGTEPLGQMALPPSHPPLGGGSPETNPGLPSLPVSHPPIGGTVAPPRGNASAPAWKIPAGWQEQAPGPMQTAKFLASGEGGSKAEATVSAIPGSGGTLLGNVNRWRGQIALPPIEASELAKQTTVLEVGPAKASVMDATSADKKKRLIAVSLSRGGETWFYKLNGDESVVAREKDAFFKFIQSNQ